MNSITGAPKQTMRFSETELDLIRSNFFENDELAKLIRKRLLQLPLSKDEQDLLSRLVPQGSDLATLLRKTVHPDIDGNAPLLQMIDLYVNADVKDKPEEIAIINILGRGLMVDYLTEMFDEFYNFEKTDYDHNFKDFTSDIKLKAEHDPQILCASFYARNTLLNHVDFQLQQLVILANTKKVTAEEVAEKNKKKSTK